MRLSTWAAIAVAIVVTVLLAGCTSPEASDSYNQNVLDFWKFAIPAILTAAGAAWAAWIAAKKGANSGVTSISSKLDEQQAELIQKTDQQTRVVVQKVEKAVDQAAQLQPADDGRRDRRHDDLKPTGGQQR